MIDIKNILKKYKDEFDIINGNKSVVYPGTEDRFKCITMREFLELYGEVTGELNDTLVSKFNMLDNYLREVTHAPMVNFLPLMVDQIANIVARVLFSHLGIKMRVEVAMATMLYLCQINEIELSYQPGELSALFNKVNNVVAKCSIDNQLDGVNTQFDERQDYDHIRTTVHTIRENILSHAVFYKENKDDVYST